MAQQKAKVRVKLDTSQAKQQLKGLAKEGEATAGRISDRMSKGATLGGSLKSGAAFGAGAALGSSAVKSVTGAFMGGVGDVFSERMGGLVADFDATLGVPEARAKQQALAETRGMFSTSVGQSGQLTDAKNYYNSVLQLKNRQEFGSNRIAGHLAGSGGKGKGGDADGIVGSIVDPIVTGIRDGFNGIVELLGGSKGAK